MNLYECITILDAGLTDEVINETITKVQDLITNDGGEVLKADPWGRRKLAYEINHHQRGFFVLFVYRAPSDINKKLEKTFKVNDSVVKYMLIRLDKKQAAATLKTIEEAKKAAEAPVAAEATAPTEAPAETAAQTESDKQE